MFLNYIKSNRPSYVLLIPIIGIALWVQTFLSDKINIFPFDVTPMPLFYLLEYYLKPLPILYNSLGFVLILAMAFLILRLNEKHEIIVSRSYLPALSLIILQSSFLPLNRLHPGLIATLIFLVVISKLFDSYKDDSLFSNFFDAGFLISLSSLFYFNSIYLMLILWITMVVLGRFSFRFWTLSTIGFIAPHFLAWSYFYASGDLDWFYDLIENNFLLKNSLILLHIGDYVLFLFILILIVIANFKIVPSLRTSKISTRKYLHTLFAIFIIEILMIIFIPSISLEMLSLVSVPVSLLLSYFLINIRNKWIGDIIILVFIILLLGEQLFPALYKYFT
ncbi:MAG: hypothetical protein U9R19_17460 [Bacteroidota bacterium]|nr:hypothetical protein [Bacteroidota bacterium]